MITENLLVQVVVVVGSILTTYLTVKYKNKIVKTDKNAPKDRMDTIFDGYEALIKQQQKDIARKQAQLESTQTIIDQLQHEIEETQKIVKQQRKELDNYEQSNRELKRQLDQMKKQYHVQPAN